MNRLKWKLRKLWLRLTKKVIAESDTEIIYVVERLTEEKITKAEFTMKEVSFDSEGADMEVYFVPYGNPTFTLNVGDNEIEWSDEHQREFFKRKES